MRIPFHKLHVSGNEKIYMQDCLDRGRTGGNGSYTAKVQQFMCDRFGCRKALLTTSGTSALELAVLLIDLKPGDQVIMPSFTFVSSANAVMLRGARPVFVDIDPLTLNIDVKAVEASINRHTRAIMPVHYAGIACDMDTIMDIAACHGLTVIEDAAQAVNASYKDRFLGNIGHLGCYSFHATKNITCGEGGALLLNDGDPSLLERAEWLWEKGTDRQRFLLGQADKYTWRDIGSSFTPADILAAYLQAQFEDMDTITRRRGQIYDCYRDSLQVFQDRGVIQLPLIPPGARPNYHIFYLLLNSGPERDWLLRRLGQRGIQSTFHYIPLHSSPMGRGLGYQPGDLPVTEDISQRLLRLPLYPSLTPAEVDYIMANLAELLGESSYARAIAGS